MIKNKAKAIALLSGGLDSRLAVKMMLEQGIELLALNFVTCFCTCTSKSSCRSEAKSAAEEYGVELRMVNHTDTLMEAVKNPKHGYGRGVNPCLDCRIAMFKEAAKIMEEENATFIVTGEVLGERPMSQRLDAIHIIERDSGLKGKILRPLSAKLFEPTEVEKEGLVDREAFLSISGRSRKPQIELAKELGLNDYPCPAGGCLLTDKAYAQKMKQLLSITSNPTKKELNLLNVGRHFFVNNSIIIVGRNEDENLRIRNLKDKDNLILSCSDIDGPTTLIIGQDISVDTKAQAAALTARYSKGREEIELSIVCENGSEKDVINADVSRGFDLAKASQKN